MEKMENIRIVRHGDTLDIILLYTVNGEPITEGSVDELEFTFGKNSYTLSGGRIYWNDAEQHYAVSLSQEETFALPNTVEYQLRVKKDDEVGGSEIEYLKIHGTISKKVL